MKLKTRTLRFPQVIFANQSLPSSVQSRETCYSSLRKTSLRRPPGVTSGLCDFGSGSRPSPGRREFRQRLFPAGSSPWRERRERLFLRGFFHTEWRTLSSLRPAFVSCGSLDVLLQLHVRETCGFWLGCRGLVPGVFRPLSRRRLTRPC